MLGLTSATPAVARLGAQTRKPSTPEYVGCLETEGQKADYFRRVAVFFRPGNADLRSLTTVGSHMRVRC